MGNHEVYGQNPTLNSKEIDRQQEFTIYQSPQGQQYQKYITSYDGTPNFLNAYQFRIQNKHPYLIDILYAGQMKDPFNCTQITKYEIVTQRIPYRLKDLSSIQAGNSLVILKSSLKGFQDLFHKCGLICVKDSMIGINSQHKVKIWLNPNFALNHPEDKPASLQHLQPSNHQKEMVHNIIDLINSKTVQDPLWFNFIHQKQHNPLLTFDASLVMIDNYARVNRLNLGGQVNNIFNKEYYWKLQRKGREVNGDGGESLVQWIDTQHMEEHQGNNPKMYLQNNLSYNRSYPQVVHAPLSYHPSQLQNQHQNQSNHILHGEKVSSSNPLTYQNTLSNHPSMNNLNLHNHHNQNHNYNQSNVQLRAEKHRIPENVNNRSIKVNFNQTHSSSTSSLPNNILFSHHHQQPRQNIETLQRVQSNLEVVRGQPIHIDHPHHFQSINHQVYAHPLPNGHQMHMVPLNHQVYVPLNHQNQQHIVQSQPSQNVVHNTHIHQDGPKNANSHVIYIQSKENYVISDQDENKTIKVQSQPLQNQDPEILNERAQITIDNEQNHPENTQKGLLSDIPTAQEKVYHEQSVLRSRQESSSRKKGKVQQEYQMESQEEQLPLQQKHQNHIVPLQAKSLVKNPGIQLLIKQVSSQRTFIHDNHGQQIPPNKNQLVFHNEKNARDVQNFRKVVNESLVDTKEIKHRNIGIQQGEIGQEKGMKGSLKMMNKSKLSYREMRKLLFQELHT